MMGLLLVSKKQRHEHAPANFLELQRPSRAWTTSTTVVRRKERRAEAKNGYGDKNEGDDADKGECDDGR